MTPSWRPVRSSACSPSHAHEPAFVQAANGLLATERDKAHAAREAFFKVWDKLDRKKSRRWMKIAPKAKAGA